VSNIPGTPLDGPAGLELAVFPLSPGSKRPHPSLTGPNSWPHVSTSDPVQIAQLFHDADPTAQLSAGCDCGKSGLYVIDIDDIEAFRSPITPLEQQIRDIVAPFLNDPGSHQTLILRSVTRGLPHVFFRQPTPVESHLLVRNRSFSFGDVKAAGGYVVISDRDPIRTALPVRSPELEALLIETPRARRHPSHAGRPISNPIDPPLLDVIHSELDRDTLAHVLEWLDRDIPPSIASDQARTKFISHALATFNRKVHDEGIPRRTAALTSSMSMFIEGLAGAYSLLAAYTQLKAAYELTRLHPPRKGKVPDWTYQRQADFDVMWIGLVKKYAADDVIDPSSDLTLGEAAAAKRDEINPLGSLTITDEPDGDVPFDDPDFQAWVDRITSESGDSEPEPEPVTPTTHGTTQTVTEKPVAITLAVAEPPPPDTPVSPLLSSPDPSGKPLPPGVLPREFWQSRPWLQDFFNFCIHEQVSPEAVLAVCLARVGACTSHKIRLPDRTMRTGDASLSLIVVPVAPSGGGKSSALTRGKKLVRPTRFIEIPYDGSEPASGQSIAEQFFRDTVVDPADPHLPTPAALLGSAPSGAPSRASRAKVRTEKTQVFFNCFHAYSEAQHFIAATGEQSSTLLATYRQMWSGEQMGGSKVGNGKSGGESRVVLGPDYVGSLVICVLDAGDAKDTKSAVARKLLTGEQVDVGTPQRILWAKASHTGGEDPYWTDWVTEDADTAAERFAPYLHPDLESDRQFSGNARLVLPTHAASDPIIVRFPHECLEESQDLRANFEKLPILDRHLPLMMKKVAANLAIFVDGTIDTTLEHWTWMKWWIAASNSMRDDQLVKLDASSKQLDDAKIKGVAREAAAVELSRGRTREKTLAEKVNLCADRAYQQVQNHAEGHTGDPDKPAKPPHDPDAGCAWRCIQQAAGRTRTLISDDTSVQRELILEELFKRGIVEVTPTEDDGTKKSTAKYKLPDE
jgi:hypothetical protein